MPKFSEFDLLTTIKSTLAEQMIVDPTEIQWMSIPAFLQGESIVGISETGSGKTLAYLLPILHLIKGHETTEGLIKDNGRPRAAVIVPSRELGEQIARVCKTFTHGTRLRVRTVLGGTSMAIAKGNIANPFEVLVATPGRLIQLMDQGLIRLDDVRTLVFDEADQMLDPGFVEIANRLVRACAPFCQLGLFSATMDQAMEQLVNKLFAEAIVIRTTKSSLTAPTLQTINRDVIDGRRFPVLKEILTESHPGSTLVFTNTRAQCDKLAELLQEAGFQCLIYRGEMDKLERRKNLRAFRDGKIDLLVSTDLAGRGLDIDHVTRIINYHLPHTMDNYVHRVGRTARAGRSGLVINLVTERDRPFVNSLNKNGES